MQPPVGGVHLLLLAATYSLATVTTSNWANAIVDTPTCLLNPNYWQLIEWFLESTTHVEITELVPDADGPEWAGWDPQYAANITRELMKKTTSLVRTFSLTNRHSGYANDTTDLYSRYGVARNPVDLNSTAGEDATDDAGHYHAPIEVIRNATVDRNRHGLRLRLRQVGAIVILRSLQQLDAFLRGPPRPPFGRANGNYALIVAYEQTSAANSSSDGSSGRTAFRQLAAHVLQILWRDYRVRKAFVVDACDNGDQLVGNYEPFEAHPGRRGDARPETPWQDNWGAMRWQPVAAIDTANGWLLRTISNFQQYPLITSVFRRYPTLVGLAELPAVFRNSYLAQKMRAFGAGYAGFDAQVASNLAAATNVRLIPVESQSYGSRQANGTYSGSLADVLYQRVDWSINGRFVESYDTAETELDFILPLFADQFCVICPAAKELPHWSAIFRCFTHDIWAVVAALNGLCLALWWQLRRWEAHIRRRPAPRARVVAVRMAYDLAMMATAAPTRMPRSSAERLLIGGCLLVNIIIVGSFQGSMVRMLSTEFFGPELRTLHQLDDSGLPIVTASGNLRNLFNWSNSTLLVSLRSKFSVAGNHSLRAIEQAAYVGNMCAVERRSDALGMIRTQFLYADGHAMVHIVDQCLRSYHLAFIAKKGSPFTVTFNYYLRRFYEAGLYRKWYQQIERAFVAQNRRVPAEGEGAGRFAFDLIDMQVAFYVLVGGVGLAVGVLVAEVWVHRRGNGGKRGKLM